MDFQSFMAAQDIDDDPVPTPAPQPVVDPGDHLDELGTKVHMSGVTGENSSTPVLAAGRPGLQFFTDFGPAYTKLTGIEQPDVATRYHEQGDINFAHLRADAERYTQIQNQVTDTLTSVRNSGNAVFESWQGDAAGSANAHFNTFLTQGHRAMTQFGVLAETITVVVDAADRICYEKAAAVKSLRANRIGPCGKDDVTFLVDFAPRCAAGDFTDEELTRAANLCGVDINPALCRLTPQIFEKVAEDVNGWLTTVFVPFYEARLAKFDAACTAAKDTLAIAWTGLREALSQVSADHFKTPTSTITSRATTATQPLPEGQIAEQAGAGTPIATASQAGPTALAETSRDDQPDESTGQSDLMAPSAVGVGVVPPTIPSASPVASPVAPAVGGYGGYGFYGGFPIAGVAGGGDRERSRSLPIAGADVFAAPTDDSRDAETGLVIGGDADPTAYNDDSVAELEQAPPATGTPDEEDDLW